MVDHTRLILGFRAAGLIVIGLTLRDVATFIMAVLRDTGVIALHRGHPDVLMGYMATFLDAGSSALNLRTFWTLLMFGIGIAMLFVRWQHMLRVIQRLERL